MFTTQDIQYAVVNFHYDDAELNWANEEACAIIAEFINKFRSQACLSNKELLQVERLEYLSKFG